MSFVLGQYVFPDKVTAKAERKTKGFSEMTQHVADHLLRVGNISALEANGLYKCRSLSRRICDLKDEGWHIYSQHKNDATGQRYVRYALVGTTATAKG